MVRFFKNAQNNGLSIHSRITASFSTLCKTVSLGLQYRLICTPKEPILAPKRGHFAMQKMQPCLAIKICKENGEPILNSALGRNRCRVLSNWAEKREKTLDGKTLLTRNRLLKRRSAVAFGVTKTRKAKNRNHHNLFIIRYLRENKNRHGEIENIQSRWWI